MLSAGRADDSCYLYQFVADTQSGHVMLSRSHVLQNQSCRNSPSRVYRFRAIVGFSDRDVRSATDSRGFVFAFSPAAFPASLNQSVHGRFRPRPQFPTAGKARKTPCPEFPFSLAGQPGLMQVRREIRRDADGGGVRWVSCISRKKYMYIRRAIREKIAPGHSCERPRRAAATLRHPLAV